MTRAEQIEQAARKVVERWNIEEEAGEDLEQALRAALALPLDPQGEEYRRGWREGVEAAALAADKMWVSGTAHDVEVAKMARQSVVQVIRTLAPPGIADTRERKP